MATGAIHEVERVGVFTPKGVMVECLRPGEVGFITAAIKSVSNCKLSFLLKNNCLLNFSFCPVIYFINKLNALLLAEVVKLVDALDSKSSFLREVWVRAPPSAQT